MTVIRNNISASTAGRFLAGAQNKQQNTLQRLASGYAINRAADDASGLAVSEKMRMYITGLNIGTRNINDGSSLCQTADGALEEVHSMLNRMYELTEQAANGVYEDQDRELINQEIETLKQEIGRIGGTANFNGIRLFPPYYSFRVEGNMEDLEIFNSSYDPVTKTATYGGITFKGERFEWPAISPGMVDANGKFVAGTYELQTSSGKLTLVCKEGWEPPQIMRQFTVTADTNGIVVDGETIPWGNLRDEGGNTFNTGNIQPGSYSFNYHGATIRVDMFGDAETLDEVITEINKHADKNMVWTSTGVGSIYSEAVDIVKVGQNGSITVQFNNNMKALLANEEISLKIRADSDGVWVEDSNGAAVGTKMTWNDMGITAWNSGSDISDNNTYTYKDSASDFQVEFQFTLINETSKDSIIQGLDGVEINYAQVGNNNKTDLELQTPLGQIISGSLQPTLPLSLSELIALGRDFDVNIEKFNQASLQYDNTSKSWSVIFQDSNSADVLVYKTSSSPGEAIVTRYVQDYANKVAEIAKKAALSGSQPFMDLADLVGSGNITTSGHLSEIITIPASGMDFTTGDGYFQPPRPGNTYPAAVIDFKDLGSAYQLNSLSGLGFDSTCKTCNNHYSVVFVDSIQSGTASTTSEGYQFSMKQTGNDYMLEIDISSLKTNGVTDGDDLSKALVSIIDTGGLDEHYTQYAAAGSKFYIIDDRVDTVPATNASFYTHPYNMPPGECDIDINLVTTLPAPPDSKDLNLSYKYDIKDIKQKVTASLVTDSAGDYVKDGSAYIPFDHTIHTNETRYRLDVTTLNVADYVEKVMEDIATHSNLNLVSTGFEKIGTSGFDELANEAVETVFETAVTQKKPSLWIQASSERDDGLLMELSALNLTVLGIRQVSAQTRESAAESMSRIYSAINKVSFIRGDFGAYYNRLGVMQQHNLNYSQQLQDAESRIRDLDISKEVMEHVKTGILLQSSQAMLSQANMLPQSVLNLLK